MEVAMRNAVKTFYYSRKKLGLYLLFNLLLLTLAILFTLTVFPDYPVVYYFAIGSCLLSIASALVVFLLPLPLAIISKENIKIDHSEPLPWTSVHSIRKVRLGKGIFSKSILRLTPRSLGNYHLTLMQRISAKSEFGSFSIPLYAMNGKDAQQIEKEIRKCFAETASNKASSSQKQKTRRTNKALQTPSRTKKRKYKDTHKI